MPSLDSYTRSQRWLPADNMEAENMPAFGVVQITGVRADGTLEVSKTTDAEGLTLAIIDHAGIPQGAIGRVTQDFPTIALDGGVSAVPGTLARPKVGAYTLEAASQIANLAILGSFSGAAGTVWVEKCNRCQIS